MNQKEWNKEKKLILDRYIEKITACGNIENIRSFQLDFIFNYYNSIYYNKSTSQYKSFKRNKIKKIFKLIIYKLLDLFEEYFIYFTNEINFLVKIKNEYKVEFYNKLNIAIKEKIEEILLLEEFNKLKNIDFNLNIFENNNILINKILSYKVISNFFLSKFLKQDYDLEILKLKKENEVLLLDDFFLELKKNEKISLDYQKRFKKLYKEILKTKNKKKKEKLLLHLEVDLEKGNIKNYQEFLNRNKYYFVQMQKLYNMFSENIVKCFNYSLIHLKRLRKTSKLYGIFVYLKKNKNAFKNFWMMFFLHAYFNSEKKYESKAKMLISFSDLLEPFYQGNDLILEAEKLKLGLELSFYIKEFFEVIFDFKTKFLSKSHSYFYFKVKDEILKELSSLYKNKIIVDKFPMVMKPVNWGEEIRGGYLMNNNYMKYDLVKSKFKNKLIILNNKYYDWINLNQSVKFKIKLETLKYIKLNLKKILEFEGIKYTTMEYKKKLSKVKILLDKFKNVDYRSKYTKQRYEKLKDLSDELQEALQKKLDIEKELNYATMYAEVKEGFYYPVTIDYRGRLYYLVTVLNIQHKKLARSLVVFYEKGNFDEYWFKIAFCRIYGVSQDSVKVKSDFIKYFDDHFFNKILELDLDFMLKSESPYETINYCLEYVKYYNYKESGNKEIFQTDLPIYFDATCSVGQLLSLLTGNFKYFEALNLTRKDEKGLGDIYIVIIKEFFEYLKNNEEKIDKLLLEQLKILFPFSNLKLWRKFLKKEIMSFFYGRTDKGFKRGLLEKVGELKLSLEESLIDFIYLHFLEFKDQNEFFNIISLLNEVVLEDGSHIWEFFLYEKGYTIEKENSDLHLIFHNLKEKKEKYIIDRITPHKGRKQLTVNFKNVTSELDKEKNVTSLKANLTHGLDAHWLKLTGILCLEDGIKSFIPLFDCVGCRYQDIYKVLYNFKKALSILFSDKDQFLNILISIKKSQNNGYISVEDRYKLRNLVNKFSGWKDSKYLEMDFFELDYVVFP